jgi:predicted nucleic acid-binding protein
MTAPVFVDTNVLLYALDESNKSKQTAAQDWRAALWQTRLGRISYQVLAEFYVNALRLKPSSRDDARAEVRDLLAWNPLVVDAAVVELGWRFQDRYRLAFWDSLILAAAKLSSCGYLLTEDLQAGQVLDGIEVVNPFLARPASLV